MTAVRNTLRRVGLSPITSILWLIVTVVLVISSLTLFTSVYAFLYLISVPESSFSVDLVRVKEMALVPENTENTVSVLISTIEAMLLVFKSVNITTSSLLQYFHSYSVFAACYFFFTFFYLPFRLKNPPNKRKQRMQEQQEVEDGQKDIEQDTEQETAKSQDSDEASSVNKQSEDYENK